MDKPVVPSHSPPTPISFMSPIPIGGGVFLSFFCNLWLKIVPISAVMIYPDVAPIMASDSVVGNGKNAININPISISGKRYASGIMRRRKSWIEICAAQYAAIASKAIKNM